jgi:hypothetical protein
MGSLRKMLSFKSSPPRGMDQTGEIAETDMERLESGSQTL